VRWGLGSQGLGIRSGHSEWGFGGGENPPLDETYH